MEQKKTKSIKKDPITTLGIKCEHCNQIQTHEALLENGTCTNCQKEIRKELF